MPIRVQLPNGSFAEFPDGMATADIEAVLARQFGAPEPPDFGNVEGGSASTESSFAPGTDIPLSPDERIVGHIYKDRQGNPRRWGDGAWMGASESRETTAGEFAQGMALKVPQALMGATRAVIDTGNIAMNALGTGMTPEGERAFRDSYREADAFYENLKPAAFRAEQNTGMVERNSAGEIVGLRAPAGESIGGEIIDSAAQAPAFIAGGGALKAASSAVLKNSPRLAAALGYGGANAALVAPGQRQDTIADAERLGMSPEGAREAGNSAGLMTAGLSAVTGGAGGLMSQIGGAGAGSFASALGRGFLAEAPFEGIEEAGQSAIGDIALGRSVNAADALDAGLLAGLTGGLPGSAIAGMEYAGRPTSPSITPPDDPRPTDLSPGTIAAGNAALTPPSIGYTAPTSFGYEAPTFPPAPVVTAGVTGPTAPAARRGELMADAILGEAKSRRLMADPILDTDALERAGVSPIVPKMEQPDVFTPAALGIPPEPTRDLASLLPESAAPPAPPPVRLDSRPAPVAAPQNLPAPLDTQAASTAQPAEPAAQPYNEPTRGQANPLEAGRLDVAVQPEPVASPAQVSRDVVGASPQALSEAPSESRTEGTRVREIAVNQLALSQDVPQFKSGASGETGVVEPLGGSFDRRGVGPIQVWKRLDGRHEVISGRHRLDLARRSGEKTIPAQVYDEAAGFDARQAASLDAELNIRDGQGKVKDYVQFFQQPAFDGETGRAEADARGLLARATGKRAYTVASAGTPELIAAHSADRVTDEAAVQVAQAAPNNEALQNLGLKLLAEGRTITATVNMLHAAKAVRGPKVESGDLFGFDDSSIRDLAAMGDVASREQRALGERIAAIRGASKRPELARKEGVDVRDPAALDARLRELTAEKIRWDSWSSHSDLVARSRSEAGLDALPEQDAVSEPEPEVDPGQQGFVMEDRGASQAAPPSERQPQADVETGDLPAQDVSEYGETSPLQLGEERGATSPANGVASGRGAAPAIRNQLDMFVATRSDAAPDQGAGVVKVNRRRLSQAVGLAQIGQFRSGHAVVDSLEKAAHILAPLRKSAQEQFLALVLDDAGKPLGVIRHTVGTIDSSMVEPGVVFSAIAAIPGASRVVFAHNHPSGNLTPSSADRTVDLKLEHLLRGSGIESLGAIIVAPGSRQFSAYGNSSTALQPVNNIAAAGRTVAQVPSLERRLTKIGKPGTGAMSSPADAARYAEEQAAGKHPSGVILLNSRHEVIGTFGMSRKDMTPLRTDDLSTGIADLARRVHGANAAAAFVYGPDSLKAEMLNLTKAINALGVRALDRFVIDGDGKAKSLASTGTQPSMSDNEFYSMPEDGEASLDSIEALRAELEASPVGRSLVALEKAGALRIIHDPKQPWAGKWDRRKATLNAANIPAGNGIGVALHELGVHAERDSLSGILGDTGFKALLATIDRWADSSDPATRDLAASVQRRVNNANTPAQHRDEERLAYAVELAANAGMESGGEIRAFLRRFAAYVKAWLSASKLGSALRARGLNFDLTPQDVAQLAAYAVARQARAVAPERDMREAEAFSIAPQSETGVEFTNGQEALESRLAQWHAAFVQDAGAAPSPVGERPESVGAVNRNATGAVEQGDASREVIREQSARLIERAKAEGFYWPANSPILAELGRMQSLGGAEHEVFKVGEPGSEVIIRATDNGFFGHRSDISPAQYLARLEDYSRTFPGLQTRLIGVSESPYIEGHAAIWTVQPFVDGEKFKTQALLSEAMARHGWDEDGYPGVPRFKHRDTGAIIEDAHTDNVFQDDNGDLYPFDVVVEALPSVRYSMPDTEPAFTLTGVPERRKSRLGEAFKRARQRRDEVNAALGNPAAGGTLGYNADKSEWVGTRGAMRAVRENMQDRHILLRDVQQDIEKARGAVLPDEQNVYRMENLMYGRVGKGMETLDDVLFDPLFAAMRKAKVKPETLEEYLYARHAKERNADLRETNPDIEAGSGMSDAEAAAILKNADPKLEALAAMVDRITRDTRKRLYSHGIITREQYEAMQKQFEFYVPLRGKADSEKLANASRYGGMGGSGVEVRSTGIKAMTGRGTRAVNILGEVIGDAQRSMIAAEKARVGRALARLVLNNPNPDLWTMEPVRTERTKDPKTGEIYDKVLNESASPDVVHVRINGQQYRILFENPKLAEAMKNVGADMNLRALGRGLQAINRYVSATLTSYNPGFIPVNMTRDAVFGSTRILTEHGPKMLGKVMAEYPKAFASLHKAAIGKPETERLAEFVGAGGKTGWVTQAAVDTLQKQVRLDTKTGKMANALRAAKALATVVEEANGVVENAMRVAYFSALRDAGWTVDAAAEKAKDLTVNFNRQGKYGPLLKIMFLFYNPGVQGAHQVIKALKNPKMQGAMLALGMAQFVLAMMAYGLEDEDGEPLANKVPDFVKERSLWGIWPGKRDENGHLLPGETDRLITLPMPYGFNVFSFLGGRMAQVAASDSKAIAANTKSVRTVAADFTGGVIKSTMQAFSPVPIDEGMAGLVPTIPLNAGVRLIMNRDGLGRRIRNENPFDEVTPLAMQGKADTHEAFKAVARGLNWIGMGDEYHKPLAPFDWAPEDIEYMYGLATGGLGRSLMDAISLGHDIATDQDRSEKPSPIIKSYTRPINEVASAQSGFYERSETIKTDAKRVRNLAEAGGLEAGYAAAAVYPHLSGVEIKINKSGEASIWPGNSRVYGAYKAADKQNTETRRQVEALYGEFGAGLSAGRTEQMRALQKENAAYQRDFIREWNAAADVFAAAR